jgi:hypothetical protein
MSSSSAWGGGVWRQLGSGAALRSEALGREGGVAVLPVPVDISSRPSRSNGIVGAGARATVGSRAMEESSGAGDGYTEEALKNRRTFCRSD